MSININTLVRTIEKSSGNALTSMQILEYAKAIEQLKIGSVATVDSVSELPDVFTVSDGSLYYVVNDKQLYVPHKMFNRWRSLTSDSVMFSLYSWGTNTIGRLGDNTTTARSSPVSVVGGFTDWCQVSAGTHHTAAIRTNGTLWAWGYNGNGRLGDNTATSRSSPVIVAGGFADWCEVSAGGSHTAAIRTNGTLWAWGKNNYGQLGDNTTVSRSSPVSVVGGFTDWCQVSAGGSHTAAVRTNGTLWAWGFNGSGQLGDNTAVGKSSPASVVGGFTNWCQVSAGSEHTAAVRTNGTLWAWGLNSTGQLGDNSTTARSSPVSVVGGFADWCQISAGSSHTAAVRTNGTLWAWGKNNYGQLGDNTATSRSSPVSVVGGFADWCQISAGSSHTAAVRTNGTLWSWGRNGNLQLGDTSLINRSSPVSVVGNMPTWKVSSGNLHNMALIGKSFT